MTEATRSFLPTTFLPLPSNMTLAPAISVVAHLEVAWFELSGVSKLKRQELAFKLTDQALSVAPAEV